MPGEDGILNDDEIEARQLAADGELPETNPKVGETGSDDAQKTVDADAAGEGALEAKPEPAAGSEGKPVDEPAAAQAAGGDTEGRPEGILSKDGTRVLPFAALQAERRSARAANNKVSALSKELETAKQLIENLKSGVKPDVDSDVITEEQVAELEQTYPEHGKVMRKLFEQAKAAAEHAPASTTQAEQEPSDDPAQDAIDQIPLLLEWQLTDAAKFGRAQEFDTILFDSPKWKDKSTVERFAEATRMVADEYDIKFTPLPGSKSTTKAAVPEPARKQPESLSDFKGGSIADHGTADIKSMSSVGLLNKMLDMSNDEIDAHLDKYG